jgi:hypothetical protein
MTVTTRADEWEGLLSLKEREWVGGYKCWSENINRFIKGLPLDLMVDGPTPTMEAITHIDNAISKFQLEAATSVYCGVGYGRHVRQCIECGVYRYRGFISCSAREDVTGNFIKLDTTDPVLLQFELPAGFPCAPLFSLRGADGGEREYLLGRELAFRIQSSRCRDAAELWPPLRGKEHQLEHFILSPI